MWLCRYTLRLCYGAIVWLRFHGLWLGKKMANLEVPVCGICRKRLRAEGPIEVMVLGVKCTLKSSPCCEECTGTYLNQFSTLCGSCLRPIFPGARVAQARMGAPHPFTHCRPGCAPSAFYCGEWGEGQLVTLHELDPETYPRGAATVLSHAVCSRSAIIVERFGEPHRALSFHD